MRTALLSAILWTGACCLPALSEDAPKIQFDQTVFDFGKTSKVETVSGIFKFKNAGDGLLKIEPPKPSCGCTVASLKPDTLKSGETGELAFTLSLGHYRTVMEKHIAVKSNDPQTPEVSLSIKVDYTPLYDVSPMTLMPILPLGVDNTNQSATITRTDGKPLRILKLEATKPWITAKLDPDAKADSSTARIRVEIKRNGPPGRFNEYLHVYGEEQPNTPVSAIYLYGQFLGEVLISPESLYWNVSPLSKNEAERPESATTRRLTIRSADGKTVEVKNPRSTVTGLSLELVLKEPGKVYELVAKLSEVPKATLSGNVSFETSVAAQPRIEVPVIVNVSR